MRRRLHGVLTWSAIVFRSKRQSKFTVATIFCRVGTIPLTPVFACPGVAAGVAGVTPLPCATTCCCPFVPFLLVWPASDDGGVRWPLAPGKESDEGAVNCLASAAVLGWVMYACDSMFASWSAPTEVSGGAVGMMDVASAMRSLMVGGWVVVVVVRSQR